MTMWARWVTAVLAAIALAAVAACGSAGGPGGMMPHPGSASHRSGASARAHSAADMAFAAGMLGLERQADALRVLAAGHGNAPVQRWAARIPGDDSGIPGLRHMMRQWHQPVPAPYRAGTAFPGDMGPGMMGRPSWMHGHGWMRSHGWMDSRDWAEMTRMHGHDFADHWAGAMAANRAAQIAYCRYELRHGTDPHARAAARSLLMHRRAELNWLTNHHNHGGHDHGANNHG
jgi:hypothetical protein